MKAMKRIAGILLAVAVLLTMALPAFALTPVTEKGSILIKNNDTVEASSKTFAAYKILDLTAYKNDAGEIVTYDYNVPADMVDFYAARYNLDKTASDFAMKVVACIREEEDIYAFAEAALNAAKTVMSGTTGTPVADGYQFNFLPLGYYVVADTTAQGDYVKPVSALVLDTATPNVEVEVKAEKPPVQKEIDVDEDLTTTEDRTDKNEAAIGDTVKYVVTTKVPDMTGYDKYFFIINDKMSKGLTYNKDVVITVGDKTLVEGTDFEIVETNNDDFTTDLKIVFKNFLQYNTDEFIGKPIVVSYTAQLNEKAEVNKTPNTNDVYLNYSNDPTVDYNGENEPNEEDENKPPMGETPIDRTETYTTTLEIVKTDPIGNRLEGAEFTLTGTSMNIVRMEKDVFTKDDNGDYWKLTDGSFTTTDPNSNIAGAPVDQSKYDSLTTKYAKETKVDYITTEGENKTVTGTVSSDGTLRFEGLGAGEFTITEIKAPDGYNMLTEELKVTITWNEETKLFEYTGAIDENGVARVTIINQAGTELPSTGGTGTTIFYLAGGILVLAAVVLLVSKKRMSAQA